MNNSCVKSRVVKYLIRLSTQHNTTKNDLLLHITNNINVGTPQCNNIVIKLTMHILYEHISVIIYYIIMVPEI